MTDGGHGNRRTPGEERFEQYLAGRGIAWTREEDRGHGQTRPDYNLHLNPIVLAEVKDFEPNAEDSRAIERSEFRGVDPYSRIRDKIHEAKAKFRQHRARGLPCVLVLYNSGSLVNLISEIIAGAMHGDLGFSVQIGDVEIDPRPNFDRRTARLRENLNTTISAVVVVEQHRPNDSLMQDEIRRRIGPAPGEFTDATVSRVFDAIEEIKKDRADVDFDQVVVRVRVVHNPHARVPLSLDVFAGEYDEQLLPNLAHR